MNVELIPVIELGIIQEENQTPLPSPEQVYWLNPKTWDHYFKAKLQRHGYQAYESIKEAYPFYHVNQFTSKKDLRRIIQAHLGQDDQGNSMAMQESCALFGGYVLKVDGEIVFTPQCCSLLSDFSTWKTVIEEEFQEGYICYEGHPSPKVERNGNELKFIFEEESESFIPPAINCIIDRLEMIQAIEDCQQELDEFASVLNALEEEFNHKNIADILIYEKS